MTKILTLSAIILMAAFSAAAQDVNIPDANFKTALINNPSINTNSDGEIQVSEAAAYTGTINVNKKNIADLTGIEAFTQITGLNCGSNKLTALNVSSNTQLTSLQCDFNLLTALDVSSLGNLSTLICSSNKLTALNISSNTNLSSLTCSRNQITSLDVSSNLLLQYLNCSFNVITSLDVSTNTGLLYFYCFRNQLTSLDISNNTAMIAVGCSSNLIGSLDVSNNPALESIQCGFCGISSLDVSNNPNLVTLSCSYNSLSSLDVSNNPALYLFYCNGNQLTSLDISANPDIHELDCSENLISSLNLSPQTNLQLLNCYTNNITSLDLSANTLLETVNCGSNQISTLNFAAQHLLTTLYCDNNPLLTSLDLRNGNNTSLIDFFAGNNPGLSCISVDDVPFMNTNWSAAIDPTTSYSLNCNCVPATITSSPVVTTNLCPGTPVTLTSSRSNSYLWSTGKKRRSITVTTSGSYTVSTDIGCSSAPTVVSYLPCDAPSSLGVTNVTATSADINFTSVACGQSYDLKYKTKRGGSWVTVTGITSSPYSISGLAPNTLYIVQMRTFCSSNPLSYSAWTVQYQFRTPAYLVANGGVYTNNSTSNSSFKISITPNPASSKAILRISGNAGNVSVSISDMSGKQLWQSLNNSSSQLSLPVQNLASGVYMVSVADGENKQVLKLVKE